MTFVVRVPASWCESSTLSARQRESGIVMINDSSRDATDPKPLLREKYLQYVLFGSTAVGSSALKLGYFTSQAGAAQGCPSRLSYTDATFKNNLVQTAARHGIYQRATKPPPQILIDFTVAVGIPTGFGSDVWSDITKRVVGAIDRFGLAGVSPHPPALRSGRPVGWDSTIKAARLILAARGVFEAAFVQSAGGDGQRTVLAGTARPTDVGVVSPPPPPPATTTPPAPSRAAPPISPPHTPTPRSPIQAVRSHAEQTRSQDSSLPSSSHDATVKDHSKILVSRHDTLRAHGDSLRDHIGIIRAHNGRLDGHDDSIRHQDSTLSDHSGQLQSIRHEITDHSSTIRCHGDDLRRQGGVLGEHSVQMQSTRDEIVDHDKTIRSQDDRIRGHDGMLGHHAGQLRSIDNQMIDHSNAIRAQGDGIRSQHTELQALRNVTDNHRIQINAQQARGITQQVTLDQHGQDLTDHRGKIAAQIEDAAKLRNAIMHQQKIANAIISNFCPAITTKVMQLDKETSINRRAIDQLGTQSQDILHEQKIAAQRIYDLQHARHVDKARLDRAQDRIAQVGNALGHAMNVTTALHEKWAPRINQNVTELNEKVGTLQADVERLL